MTMRHPRTYPVAVMKQIALYVSLGLLLLVVLSALRAVVERRLLFFRKWDDTTRQPYMALAVAAAGLLAWSLVDMRRIQSFEIAGVKATLTDLQERVQTLSDQLEEFYKRKKIETFNAKNSNRVRRVGTSRHGGSILEVVLEQPPIPGSVEVFEGVLPMPEVDFQLDGRTLRFPSNLPKVGDELPITIKYYPRLRPATGNQHESTKPPQPKPTP